MTPPRWQRNGRALFAGCWLLGQVALVLSAGGRPDHIFGFRMFPEASTLEIHLWRETATGDVRAPGGAWGARDRSGQLRHFAWRDRVHDPGLASVDVMVFASYGVDAQLLHLARALDDVSDHLDGDDQTRRLRAEVVVRRNGRDPEIVRVEGHPRGSP